MKFQHVLTMIFSIALVSPSIVANDTATKDGKTVFAEQKCNMCHSVTSADVASKKKSGAVDLSNTGAHGNADFFAKFLKKDEAIKGKKHSSNWRGNEGDLEILAAWLATLKSE